MYQIPKPVIRRRSGVGTSWNTFRSIGRRSLLSGPGGPSAVAGWSVRRRETTVRPGPARPGPGADDLQPAGPHRAITPLGLKIRPADERRGRWRRSAGRRRRGAPAGRIQARRPCPGYRVCGRPARHERRRPAGRDRPRSVSSSAAAWRDCQPELTSHAVSGRRSQSPVRRQHRATRRTCRTCRTNCRREAAVFRPAARRLDGATRRCHPR